MIRIAAGLAAALAFGTPGQAANDPPFAGKWAVEGSKACTAQTGDNDLLLTITTKRLSYYASTCDVISARRVSRSGDNAHRFKLRCTGEGRTSNTELILVVLEKNELRPDMLLHIEPTGWAGLCLAICDVRTRRARLHEAVSIKQPKSVNLNVLPCGWLSTQRAIE